MENIKQYAKRSLAMTMAVIMMISAFPLQSFAEGQQAKQKPKKPINYDNEDLNHRRRLNDDKLPVLPARPEAGKTSGDFVKDPAQPAIYTLRTDFKAEKGEKYSVNYQPYVSSVGEAASDAEKAKVNKEIKLPNMAGYEKPAGSDVLVNSYDAIVNAAKFGHQTGDAENGFKYLALAEKRYKAKENTIVVKHVFQDMDDFTEFSNPDETITKVEGTEGKIIKKVTKEVNGKQVKEFDYANPETVDLTNPNVKEEFFNHEELSSLRGNTGSTLEVQALPESQRKGFEPQIDKLKTQVPEDTRDFKIEYRYNRAAYDVVFDTKEGTPLPTRTYYFNQEIPKLDTIPSKIGCEFLGWKPSHELEGIDGTKYKKGEIIRDKDGNAIVDLGNTFYKKDGSGKFLVQDGDPVKGTNKNEIKLKMPALKLGDGKTIPREKLTFTAVWKDKEKADYAIQFWVEKADHPDNASLLNKYDYMGTRVHQNANTGSTPNLDTEPVKGLRFPDLDQKRLDAIWRGDKFYGGQYLLLNKFFVYNKDLTNAQNKDSNTNVTKTISATGKTVYNIYYNRQVYDLYFTKSNVLSAENTFYPEIYVPDGNGGAKLAGGPGNPYHYSARFNQLMLGWPNDAMQTKGFAEGKQSYGWGPNYGVPDWPLHLDTPPYRLNADEFVDMIGYDDKGGYVSKIDKGDGTTIDVNKDPRYKDAPYKALSFGIKQEGGSMPHHMDFWMDGFKDGETIIRYDLYRSKADTNSPTYGHRYSKVQGFTPYGTAIEEGSEEHGRITEDDIDALNDERGDITPYPNKDYTDTFGFNNALGHMNFKHAFFNNADPFGDALDGNSFDTNGYIRFKYHRNKYPLRFNTDPTKIKDDSAFNDKNSLETFYEFPLISLNPELDHHTKRDDKEYFKDHPANFLDDPNNLFTLGLHDLLQRDKSDPKKFAKDAKGNYRVKRPEGLSDQMVFKGWAMDPNGQKMVWKNDGEKMPNHPVNLYAIWDEPDYKWKVTVDPNGGKLDPIGLDALTTEKKTIKEKEGDNEEAKPKEYPVKGYMAETAEAGKQVFTVVQRQKLKDLPKPTRYGYDFMGWEVIRYKKDASDNYTNEQDTSYRQRYNVPELYSFGTDVVSPIYLKAIWVENKRANVQVRHYFLKNDFSLDEKKYPNPEPGDLDYKRVGDYVPTTGEKQDEHWILATNDELMEKLHGSYKEQVKDATGNVIREDEHELLPEYKAYNGRVGLNNTFFQSFRVQPDKKDEATGQITPNPENIFRFYYRPFRTRNYKVNYIDERGKEKVEEFFKGLALTDIDKLKDTDDYKNADEKGKEAILKEANIANKAKFKAKREELEKILDNYKVIDKEDVTSECRHYDARNYRHIPGWKLASDAQQQLFYDVNENTNEFLGINGKGSNEIYFYYKDARVIETKEGDPVPDGYVRVTFKIDDKNKGGVFKDKDGKEVTELHYDVIKGLKSDLLPKPIIWEGGKDDKGNEKKKEANRYYITPDQGKSFKGWDNDKWLNAQTEINRNYTFTAYFDWSGMSTSSKGLVRTEAYTDPNGKWTNAFAPKLADLKAQLVWKEGNEVKPIPADTKIEFVYKDEGGQEKVLTTDEELFNLVKEMKAEDKDQTVRVLNIVAKVTFKNGDAKKPQELPIPITVYKNRYEALNEKGDKPIYLTEAEGKEAKDGGLKDILKDNTENRYIKVTIKPNKDFDNKDNKVYYVNPNAWVDIPKVESTGDSRFTNWTADIADYNEESKENGIFDFAKRHKFTKDTIITPVGADDVVEQEKGKDKPDVPKSYVKVIVKTTDKATTETAFERTFWVNPKENVTIDVKNPTGKTNQEIEVKSKLADGTELSLGKKKVNYLFKEWQIVKTGAADDQLQDVKPARVNLASQKYTDKVTVIEAAYKNEIQAEKPVAPLKTTKLDTPEGKEITDEILKGKITPQEGKEIASIEVISKPDGKTPGNEPAKVIVKYKDGTTQGTNDKPVVVPVEVHKNIIPEAPGGQRPKDAMANYVKVTFTAGEGGKLDKTLTGNFTYYVSPEVEVDMTATADAIGKIPATGYIKDGGKWVNKDNKALKGTFADKETVFKYDFFKSDDIIEKTNDNVKKPKGYVTVIFRADTNGKLEGNIVEKTYFVNPYADIKLKVLGENETAGQKELAVPKTVPEANYSFKGWVEPIDDKPIKGDQEHVAKFEKNGVKLTYDAGGGKGTVPPVQTADYGGTVRLANADGLKKDNSVFAGWKIGNDVYKEGQEVTLNGETKAVAQWELVKHKVDFDTQGGSNVASQEVEHGKTATNPEAPKLDGKVFMGWKENASDENYFNFSTPITANKTLIAIWQDSVQKIDENTKVEGEFIKVIFLQGAHGELVPDKDKQDEKTKTVIYKVAKDLTFNQAVQGGLKVPGIQPAQYFKVKEENSGWDKALKLKGKETTFTAQYELVSDLIPVDTKDKTPEEIEKLKQDKPEGTVVVDFKIADPNNALLDGTTFYYVKKDAVVTIDSPAVMAKIEDYTFDGWKNAVFENDKFTGSFNEDTTITDTVTNIVGMTVRFPVAGQNRMDVLAIPDDETGKLQVIRGGNTYDFGVTTYTRRRKIHKIFNLSGLPGGCIQSGDMIKYWTEKNGQRSKEFREVIK